LKNAKLSVFKSIFVPILLYGHESWAITERILSQVQAEERRDFCEEFTARHFTTKRATVKFVEALNIEPLL